MENLRYRIVNSAREEKRMTFKGKEITKELLEKAEKCQTADELMALAKENDIELTVDEAQAFLDESADVQLDAGEIDQAAGGSSGKQPYNPKAPCKSRVVHPW